ncbi:hypothetical protein Bca4012_091308 [Brassica carinata]
MIWRRWDPGIGRMEIMGEDKEYLDDYGEWHRRSFPDTGIMDKGNRRNLRKHRILGNWGQISMVNQILIINKKKSQISKGIDSDFGGSIWIFLFIKEIGIYSSRCDLFGAWRIWYDPVFGNENRLILGIKCGSINFTRYDLYEGIFWRDYLVKGLRYKMSFLLLGCYTTFTVCLFLSYNKPQQRFLILLIMAQSHLLGQAGETKNGEGARKRLKISVAHFDNSALIKTYSKTLIGRCMNPEEQDMNALFTKIPKIWKLEERVTALARWHPKRSQLLPSEIPFWVRLIGVPLEFRTVPAFESIGNAIGKTVAVDLDHTRVQVVIDAFKELCFETTVDFKGGGEEKCSLCVKNTVKSPERKRESREENGGWSDGGKHDERARSYKGVVINGNVAPQNKDRGGQDYYGKGKGKMYEGSEAKEEVRSGDQETRTRPFSGQTSAQRNPIGTREESREEGEFKVSDESSLNPPSQEFQLELARTQAEGTEVVSDPTDEGMGLQIVNGLFEEQEGRVEDDDMEMDALEANLLESGFDLGAEEDFQTLSEEEDEKALAKGDEVPIQEKGLVESDTNKGESKGAGDASSKQGNRKRIFKPTSSTVGSTKMRIANALVKRAASKGVTRYGNNGKPPEAKGTSNPKEPNQKS